MSTNVHLDRKEIWTFALIGVMLVLLAALAVRSYVAKVTESRVVHAASSTDQRLVAIDGATTLLEPQKLGDVMADWVKSKHQTLEFELSDSCFVPNAAAPSSMGRTRVLQIIATARAHASLMVHILLPTNAAKMAARPLDNQRAERIRDALVSGGVTASQITVGAEPPDVATANSQQIAILLVK